MPLPDGSTVWWRSRSRSPPLPTWVPKGKGGDYGGSASYGSEGLGKSGDYGGSVSYGSKGFGKGGDAGLLDKSIKGSDSNSSKGKGGKASDSYGSKGKGGKGGSDSLGSMGKVGCKGTLSGLLNRVKSMALTAQGLQEDLEELSAQLHRDRDPRDDVRAFSADLEFAAHRSLTLL